MTRGKKTTTTETTTMELVTTLAPTTTTEAPEAMVVPQAATVEQAVEQTVKVVPATSPSYSLDAHDVRGLLRNLLLVVAAYGVTYFSTHVMAIDVDQTTMTIVVGGVLDTILRYFKDNTGIEIK